MGFLEDDQLIYFALRVLSAAFFALGSCLMGIFRRERSHLFVRVRELNPPDMHSMVHHTFRRIGKESIYNHLGYH